MNKLFALAIIVCCLAVVSAQHNAGGFQKIEFTKDQEDAYKLAVGHLVSEKVFDQNGVAQLQEVQQQVVSGVIYKFIISDGSKLVEVEVLSQEWLNVLVVQKYRVIPRKNLRG